MRLPEDSMRKSFIVGIVAAATIMLSGCGADAAEVAQEENSAVLDQSEATSAPDTAAQATGAAFADFPTCVEFNSLSIGDQLALFTMATGVEYTEEIDRQFAVDVQLRCEVDRYRDKSVLASLSENISPDSELQVAWSHNTDSGSWGGFTFPAEIDGYRLIGEAEYNEFVAMQAEICPSMQDLGDPLVNESNIDGLSVRALYTTFDGPIAPAGACVWGADTIPVLYSQSNSDGFFSTAQEQPNGSFCTTEGLLVCSMKAAQGSWTAVDRPADMDVAGIATFLATVVSAQ